MGILSLNLEEAVPMIILPILLIWFGFISAGNCIKPFTVTAVVSTVLQTMYLLSLLTGIQLNWYVAYLLITLITIIVGFLSFGVVTLRLVHWNGETMSDLTRKERMKNYSSLANCYSFMSSTFIFVGLIVSIVLFFRYKELNWFYMWIMYMVINIIINLVFTIVTRKVIYNSKICKE